MLFGGQNKFKCITILKRLETDSIGSLEINEDALYGIHSSRAVKNFPGNISFHIQWYQALGLVKQSVYLTVEDFIEASQQKYPSVQLMIKIPDTKLLKTMGIVANEISNGRYFDHFIVPALCGGAGTSINMNVNEIITNVSLLMLGHSPGNYSIVDPLEDANVFQSTNDVVPTALKIALLKMLESLEIAINNTRFEVEKLEQISRHGLRVGYTQMQSAAPVSIGRQFSAYNDAFSRDWWRVSKCKERLKTVNLGGSAVGTGLAVPQYLIMNMVQKLSQISGLSLSRAENLMDATSNLDTYVEVHAILKAHAVNLEKFVSDLRILASDVYKPRIVELPPVQMGSSIMPGKVNPVIPEFVISSCQKIYSNDILVSNLCSHGTLELNAYIPLIGHAMLESIDLLINANRSIRENMLNGILIHTETSLEEVYRNPSVTTALLPLIGYHKASELSYCMKSRNLNVFEANEVLGILSNDQIVKHLEVSMLMKEGFSMKDFL